MIARLRASARLRRYTQYKKYEKEQLLCLFCRDIRIRAFTLATTSW